MKFNSIRTKLVAAIVALTLAVVLLQQGVNLFLVKNAFSELVPLMMEASLQSAHRQIHAKLEENLAALNAVASMPYITDANTPLSERAMSLDSFVKRHAADGYQACAVTDATGRAVLSSGFEIDVSGDEYFRQAMEGNPVVSDPFVSRATGNLLIVYAVPYYDANGSVAGVITLDVDALHLSKEFQAEGLGKTGVAFAITSDGTTVVSSDIETVKTQYNDFKELANDPSLASIVESEKKMISGQSGSGEHIYNGVRELMYYMPVEGTSWGVAVTEAKSEAYATVNAITTTGFVVLATVILISIVAAVVLARSIVRPIRGLATAADRLAIGDIGVNVDVHSRDEVGVLSEAFWKMTESIRQQAQAIDSISQGDYTVSVPVRSEQDVMNQSINHMVKASNQLMREIREAAAHVASTAVQIANGSQMLATGSTQQAATMQEFSASIGEVYNQATANTQLAGGTVRDVQQAGSLMDESLRSMQEMTQAMNAIEDSSRKIGEVIKVIDSIAFQTNILALNAAVEAARAGQHGKGFAVVADEVRNLAGKSAEAAKETAELINESVSTVERGVQIAERTSQSLTQVGELSRGNMQAMDKVSQSSTQQGEAIREINHGITQISNVVQANSATAEESAAVAQELRDESVHLNEIVERFKLMS